MKMFILKEEYKSRKAIEKAYPDLSVIHPVKGGWLCFQFASDFEEWKNQK